MTGFRLTSSNCAAIGFLILLAATGCGTRKHGVQVPDPLAGQQTVGIASWYGDPHHGRKTSSGELFDKFALTAAHRTLPFNTMVRVNNLANGKQVEVRINDRGPFHEGRIIDLSYAAAMAIDMIQSGTARVRLEIRD